MVFSKLAGEIGIPSRTSWTILALLFTQPFIHAASTTWTGGGNGSHIDKWNDGQNWGSSAPGGTTDAIFSSVAAGNSSTPNINAAGLIVNAITFNAGAASFTIGGANSLTLNGGGIVNNATNAETFTAGLVLGAAQTWFGNAGSLTVNATNLSGFALTIYNDAGVVLAGAVSGTGSGSSLTKAGAGTLTMQGNNTYMGRTTISGGTLLLGNSERIANASPVTLAGGKLSTGGFSETLGALTLSSNSVIDFGSGTSTVSFAASNGLFTGGTTLSIYNWTANSDHLIFGSSSSALNSGQLSQISFGS